MSLFFQLLYVLYSYFLGEMVKVVDGVFSLGGVVGVVQINILIWGVTGCCPLT